jgi:hypothetical protein
MDIDHSSNPLGSRADSSNAAGNFKFNLMEVFITPLIRFTELDLLEDNT